MAWAPDYATATELKSYLRIGDSLDDAVIAWAITSASRAIDQATNRQFGLVASPEARYYNPYFDRNRNLWVIEVDDLMTNVGLVVDVDTNDDGTYSDEVTDSVLRPRNAAAQGRPWTEMTVAPSSAVTPSECEGNVRVTARWGWSSIPVPVVQATLLQAGRLVARRDAPFGVAGSPELGNELRLLAKVDPDVEVIVRSFRRVWGAA